MLIDNSTTSQWVQNKAPLTSDNLGPLNRFFDKFDFQDINVDSDVYFDTLTFSGIESDLEQGFSHIYNQYYY